MQAPPERVNYAIGVLLDAEDFLDEQTYHRGRLAKALKHLVGFGTLAGLRVIPPADGDAELELQVAPGLAVDRYGRLVEIGAPQCIRLARWFAAQSTPALLAAIQRSPRVKVDVAVVVDVFLSADACPVGKTPAFATGPYDALDAVTPARLADAFQLQLVPRDEGPPNPIPAPQNFWPAPGAAHDTLLQAVLESWEDAPATADETLAPPAGARGRLRSQRGAAGARDGPGHPGRRRASRHAARPGDHEPRLRRQQPSSLHRAAGQVARQRLSGPTPDRAVIRTLRKLRPW